jgi:thiol-disulfide isomerase/thioredoxin
MKTVTILLATLLLTSFAPAFPPSVLPAFMIQDIDGNSINLQSFKGKKVFVNLWATWCSPCRREMPSIEQLASSVDTSKVAFVMISLDNTFDRAIKYKQMQKLNLPIYYPGESLPPLFAVKGIPTTFIFNEKGQLTHRIDGGDDYNTARYRKLLQ